MKNWKEKRIRKGLKKKKLKQMAVRFYEDAIVEDIYLTNADNQYINNKNKPKCNY